MSKGPISEWEWVKSRYPEVGEPHITAYTIVDWLKHLYSLDPNLVYALVHSRFPANKLVAEDEDSAVVDQIPVAMEAEPQFQVGLVGLLNGLLAYAECEQRIGAVYLESTDDEGRNLFDGFAVVPTNGG
jgi:hypothetical protein